MTSLIEILVGLPLLASILLKITIVLGVSWFLHFILAKRNPRWRILLWRCAITGLLLIPILVPFGYLQISIQLPPKVTEITEPKPALEYSTIETPIFSQSQQVGVFDPVSFSEPEVLDIPVSSFSFSEWLGENIWMIIFFSWCLVVVISILRLSVGFIRIKKRIVSSLSGPEHLQQLLDRVANGLSCTQRIELRYSPDMSTPFLTGLLRPIIILPERMIDEKYESKWVAIFAHEAAHLRSRDLIWILVIRWLEIILWFHPLIWRFRKAHSSLCEEVCDAVAAEYIGNTESYSSTLASLALEIIGRVPVVGGIPMARSSEIMERLQILKKRIYPVRLARRWIIISSLTGLIVLTAIGGLSLVYAEDSEVEKHILHFPKDRSLGTIKVRDWDKPSRQYFDWEFLNQWETFAEAKGDVIVPKDKKLALVINKEVAKDLSPLLSLQPDIFHILSLYNSEATDEALQYIVHLQGLEQLNLARTKVTDDGLKQLTKLKLLKRLHLADTTIGDEGVANISGMSLEHIKLWRTNITDQALRYLSKIKSLEVLGLMWVDIGDPGLIYLKDLNQLKGLTLVETKITDKGIESLKDLTGLEHLGLSDTAVSDIGIKHLSNLKNLKELDLDGTNVSDNGLEHLTSLPSLEKIRLPSHGSITDKGLASLCKIGSLKELDLTGGFTDQGLAQLLKLKNLEKLRIILASEITDDGMQHIAKIPSLKLLWIQHTSVSDKGIEKLKSLDKLEELMLYNNSKFSITYDSLQHLSQFPNLKKLYLTNIKASQAGLKYLGALKRLEELQIATFVTDVNALKVDETELQHLSELNNLKNLHLSNIQITDNGMKYLSDLTSLEKLDIFSSKPQITDEGIKYLVDNKKLKSLMISALITDDGIKSLAELKSLEIIHLSDATVTQESLDKLYVQLPRLQLVRLESSPSPEKKPKTGQLAPDFEVTTIKGDKFHLSEQRGKYVLVHFWATWCGPCIKSMPMIKEFHVKLSEEKNFTSISLNCDSREYVMKDYIEKNGLTWPQAWISLRGEIKRQYGVVGVPEYFLIDPDGKIIHSSHRFDEVKTAIIEVLQ